MAGVADLFTPAEWAILHGASYDLAANARRYPLSKVRSHTVRIECGLTHEGDSDASWETTDGFVVHRYTDKWDCVNYIVRSPHRGRWHLQDTLDDARRVVHLLRAERR